MKILKLRYLEEKCKKKKKVWKKDIAIPKNKLKKAFTESEHRKQNNTHLNEIRKKEGES